MLLRRLRSAWRGFWSAEEQAALARREYLATLDRLVEAQTAQAQSNSEALIAQANAFRAYIDALQPPSIGEGRSWVMNDDMQLALAQREAAERGDARTWSWVLDNSGR